MMLQRFTKNFVSQRNFMRSAFRKDAHDVGGEPGKNVPFNIDNRYTFTLLFTTFITSAMAIPFLAVRHQLLK